MYMELQRFTGYKSVVVALLKNFFASKMFL